MRIRIAALLALVLSLAPVSQAGALPAQGFIATTAGTGTAGLGADGLATSSALNKPKGMGFDDAGNLYIADSANDRIQIVDSTGNVTTIAGTGLGGRGTGGAATSSALDGPSSATFDSDGAFYIADAVNHRVQKVDSSGNVTTIAGSSNGSAGLGADGPAIGSALRDPRDIVFDATGNLYIADSRNHRVQRIDADGNISTVAGTGTLGLGADGAATASALYRPENLAFDAEGNLYIADTYNHRIQRVDTSGNVSTFAGTGVAGRGSDGPAADSALKYPVGIAFDGQGNLYIVDSHNERIQMVDTQGAITTAVGSADGTPGAGPDGPATDNTLNRPHSIAFDPDGNLYIAEVGNNRVRKLVFDDEAPTIWNTSWPHRIGDGTIVSYSCADMNGVGINSCTATLNGQSVNDSHTLTSRGSYTLTVTATDNAGNTTTRIESFSVAGLRELTGDFANATGQAGSIARLYMATFARNPDIAGHTFWHGQLSGNAALQEIAERFINSPEFRTWQASDGDVDFIERLYNNVLTRPSEPEGYEYWLGRLNGGLTRAEMLVWFSESPEFRTITYSD